MPIPIIVLFEFVVGRRVLVVFAKTMATENLRIARGVDSMVLKEYEWSVRREERTVMY